MHDPEKEASCALPPTDRAYLRWFTDRPLAVKLGSVVALMALVACVIAAVAVNGVQALRDGEQRLHHEVVEPLDTLGAIQRSFQGDRVRIVSYNVADAETRTFLRDNLAERQTESQSLLAEYDGRQADDTAWTAFNDGLVAYYATADQQMAAIDAARTAEAAAVAEAAAAKRRCQGLRPGDRGRRASWSSRRTGSMTRSPSPAPSWSPTPRRATRRPLPAAAEAADGEDLASRVTTEVVIALVLGLVLAAALAVVVVRMLTRTVGSVRQSLEAMAAGDLTVRPVAGAATSSAPWPTPSPTRRRAPLGDGLGRRLRRRGRGASEELSASSQQIAAGAEETTAQAGVVSGAAEEVSRNVQTVAAGAEEMGASIREIAQNANEAARVAAQAVADGGDHQRRRRQARRVARRRSATSSR